MIGSDPDPLALGGAQRKAAGLSGIRFEQGYAQRLPYADGEFDRVLSSMMLHHWTSEAKAAAAAEIFRVLRPGGRLHVVDIGGDMTAHDGLSARLILHSHHGGRQPRRRDTPAAARGGIRVHRGSHAQRQRFVGQTHLLQRHPSGLALVDSHLDGAAVALVGDRQEGVAPLLQPEGVGQHGTQVDSAAATRSR